MEDKRKIVVFTGAGIDKESGIDTFRDIKNGLWYNYNVEEVATAAALKKNPAKVNEFHNMLRAKLKDVEPNTAHTGIVVLEDKFDVTIVTQNVSDLHERAGSTKVLHLHGELYKSRSTFNPNLIYDCYDDINIGDKCEKGSQLRPHTVLFDEYPYNFEESEKAIRECNYLLIIGTSLQIGYTTTLLSVVNKNAKIYYVDPAPVPYLEAHGLQLTYIKDTATNGVPVAIMDIIMDNYVSNLIDEIRQSTFHMSDEEAKVIIDEYLESEDGKVLLATHSRDWYYLNC